MYTRYTTRLCSKSGVYNSSIRATLVPLTSENDGQDGLNRETNNVIDFTHKMEVDALGFIWDSEVSNALDHVKVASRPRP